ncbi:MAG: hypothetical protein WC729_25650 [Sphingomonas sp.]|jgi:hypothetical protein|uniref:hypothetical protein n=1 Tax=Sphingomonas sp. TaxID=28214 RepID=UPI0035687CE6
MLNILNRLRTNSPALKSETERSMAFHLARRLSNEEVDRVAGGACDTSSYVYNQNDTCDSWA